MSLILEIEFLTGVYRATTGPESETPGWPPQPDRVFSALVSAWGVRGERPQERMALKWLEEQAPPIVHASEYAVRTAPDVFVPPNDAKSSTAPKTYLKVLPDRRPRQPRRFPAAHPASPVLTMVWAEEPDVTSFEALNAMAHDVGYVGHSASLARCHFLMGDAETSAPPASHVRRRIYPGRMAELERAHSENPVRPVIAPGAANPGPSLVPVVAAQKWLVLEAIDGEVPDIRAAALVCRLLRRALMSGYGKNAIPEVISGHAPDGKPTLLPHLAVVPMTFTGFPHADGKVLGFALIPPAGTALSDIPGLIRAWEKVARYDQKKERRVLDLKGELLRRPLSLSPAGVAAKRSLSTEPYLKPARVWASVTPIVLDRHLKRNDEDEIRELVAGACENAGLSQPDPDRIQVGKHSLFEGVPPTRPLSGAPPWTRWKVPGSLSSRSLTHAVIDFGCETAGPVLLGAGRFAGLGLCRGLKD